MANTELAIEDRVREFISRECGIAVRKLRPDADLDRELGVTGDDAEELMEAFAGTFGIDLTGTDFGRHFGPEAGYGTHPDYGRFPVTVNHLIAVAKAGRWFDPPSISQ